MALMKSPRLHLAVQYGNRDHGECFIQVDTRSHDFYQPGAAQFRGEKLFLDFSGQDDLVSDSRNICPIHPVRDPRIFSVKDKERIGSEWIAVGCLRCILNKESPIDTAILSLTEKQLMNDSLNQDPVIFERRRMLWVY